MDNNRLFRIAGWSAYLSATALIFAFITSVFLRTKEGRATVISDVGEILSLFFMIPIVIASYQRTRVYTNLLSLIAFVIGIIGTVYSTAITFLLNFGPKNFEDSGMFMNITMGFWFLTTNFILLFGKAQSQKLSWLGVFIGAMYLLGVVGLLAKESLIVLFAVSLFVVMITYPIWAFGLGRVLLKSKQEYPIEL